MSHTDIAALKLTLNEKTKGRYAFYFALGIIAITTIDELYGKEIFRWSIEVSKYLQTFNLYRFCYILSYHLHYMSAPYFSLAPFFKRDKVGAVLSLFSIFLSLWIYTLLKLIYADMRPNYISTALRSDVGYCEKDYGKPSGHALFNFVVYLNFYKDLRTGYFKKTHRPIVLLLIVMIMPTLICFSRLYFGVHSINQLAIGAAYGVICFLLIETYSKQIKLFLLLPIFYPDDFPMPKKVLRSRLLLILFILNMSQFIIWLFRYLEEGGKESVFEHIINCLIVKENVELNFSVRLFSQGTLFNLMLAILIGMNESREQWNQVLHFAYDWNIFYMGIRFAVFSFPLFVIKIMQKITLSNVQAYMLRSFLLYTCGGYVMGRYSCKIIEILGVPLYREKNFTEQKKKQ